MILHIVFYKAYPGNPQAVDLIINEATKWLKDIPLLVKDFWVGRVVDFVRVVGNNQYDVALFVSFRSVEDYQAYMRHSRHMSFVAFVLRGWRLKDSKSEDPQKEFMEHILADSEPVEWERNLAIPDNEVVWDDEMVTDITV
ncbi:MAG: Dabb family protein [bacterium]